MELSIMYLEGVLDFEVGGRAYRRRIGYTRGGAGRVPLDHTGKAVEESSLWPVERELLPAVERVLRGLMERLPEAVEIEE